VSQGSFTIFFERPIALTFLLLAAGIIIASITGAGSKRRRRIAQLTES
jgi:TctA family transporter